jgi:hypothetical protein
MTDESLAERRSFTDAEPEDHAEPSAMSDGPFRVQGCWFDVTGWCVPCQKFIASHAEVTLTATMTREEILARWPDAKLPEPLP